jgi:hypothetical protein
MLWIMLSCAGAPLHHGLRLDGFGKTSHVIDGSTSAAPLRAGLCAQTPVPPLPLQAPALSAHTRKTQQQMLGGGQGQ